MRNLLNFIIKYSSWFVFIFYLILSIILLVSNNAYQGSVYLTSANVVSSGIYGTATNITDYFNLRSVNKSLQESNDRLSNEVLNLQHDLAEYKALLGDSAPYATPDRFDYISAAVLNNSVSKPCNYFTINRGSEDGITTGMGVVNHQGVLGIVNVTGLHTSRVISLLNQAQHFSVKLKGTSYVGSLSWKGQDPKIAYMEDVPQHVKYHIGDTVVTSGYSTSFPEGIPVGTVMSKVNMPDNNYNILKIRLITDFRKISAVRIIKDIYKEELDSLTQYDQLEIK